jgi:hypothetical protein
LLYKQLIRSCDVVKVADANQHQQTQTARCMWCVMLSLSCRSYHALR